jgi:hypothetical protein
LPALFFVAVAGAQQSVAPVRSPSQHVPLSIRLQEHPLRLSDSELLTEIERRAYLFFWEQSDRLTGLTKDRAHNVGDPDTYTVASTASTGYALASLPIAVEHGWVDRDRAYDRALLTLQFVHDRMPAQHGWYYHFIDMHTGQRVWNCEVSTIDTVLLVEGALAAAQYWRGTEVERLANVLYDGLDWNWARTNGGLTPEKLVVSMGWTPEKGFIPSNWDHYCELMQIYILGLGAKNPLPKASWAAWKRDLVTYGGIDTLAGGPIFMHQMAQSWFNFHNTRDSQGWDYWVSSRNATQINRKFCEDLSARRKTYAAGYWGLNASDAPTGYRAYGAPGEEDGTVSPTGAVASLLFTPKDSLAVMQAMYDRLGSRLWGRYGFADAFNLDADWFDPDVIGIDLGMALLAIEDSKSGLPWKLMASDSAVRKGWKAAGLHITHEPEPRPMHKGAE